MKKINSILLLAVLVFFTTNCFSQEPVQTLNVSGLKENVTVRRDGRGIAYIESRNEADLYFAQGYVTAQDRLWQLDLLRRVATGETAEIFGKITLEQDKRWRKYGFAGLAEESLKHSAPEILSALENYARGVNAYLATLDQKTLPVEFQILQFRPREWRPTDSVLIGAILADGLSTTWHQDLLKDSLRNLPKDKVDMLFAPQANDDVLLFGKDAQTPKSKVKSPKSGSGSVADAQMPNSQTIELIAQAEQIRKDSLELVGLYAEFLAASNNWVISGKRTSNGKPILANDPHLPPSQPPIWYMIHLSMPNLKVAGVTFPGAPGVVLGHNESIAWGATNVGPDVQDLYLETINDKNQYKTPQGWEAVRVRKEEIKVRKNPVAPETETEILEVVNTRNGVIFTEDGGKKYSLKWTAFDPKLSTFDAFYYVNRAKNWEEYKNALKTYGGAMQNFVYADGKGNIGWYAAGKVPIRKSGDGSLPYDGSTDAGDWTGFIPFEELPHLYNPPEGFIVTANQRTVGNSYKYHDYIARVFVPFRAKRIHDLINANPKMTVDATSDIQMDTFSILHSRFARDIVNQKAASDETMKLFADWNGRMESDSQGALLADEIRSVFIQRLLAANFGADVARRIRIFNEGNLVEKIMRDKPKDWLPKEFSSYTELLKASEIEARDNLIKKIGIDRTKWTWGEAYKIRFPHALVTAPLIGLQFNVPVLPSKGSGGSGASPFVGAGVSMRLIANPPNWDETRHVITTGQNGDPKSPHWADQINDWYRGTTPVFPFSDSAVKTAAKNTVLLTPK